MKYLAETIVGHIVGTTRRAGGTLRFILPSYPSSLLVNIGRELEEAFLHEPDRTVAFRYGIACRLGQEWQSGSAGAQEDFECANRRGWYNADDNLTSLRNIVKPADNESLVIVLAGYEHIDDRGSLQDFFHLDEEAIWNLCLGGSFKQWVARALEPFIDLSYADAEINAMADALGSLYQHGLAHVLQVSEFLSVCDFSRAHQPGDAYAILMEGLGFFNLPPMPSLAQHSARKRDLNTYVGPAQEFLNYSMFLDDSKRRKHLRNISEFRTRSGGVELDRSLLGDFAAAPDAESELLDALEDYIRNRSDQARRLLATADFAHIYEKVLGYKEPKPRHPPSTPKIKSLTGLPPEVFLHAIWIALASFANDQRNRSAFGVDIIERITLQSVQFRHSFDAGAGGDDDELAEAFLRQVLGGIDALIENHLRLPFDDDNEGIVEVRAHLAPGGGGKILSYSKRLAAQPALDFQVVISRRDSADGFIRKFRWLLPEHHQSRLLVALYRWASEEYRNAGNALPAFAIGHLDELFLARDEESVNWILGRAMQNRRRGVVDLLRTSGIDRSDTNLGRLVDLSGCHQAFVEEACGFGFFSALSSKYVQLRHAYRDALEASVRSSAESALGPILMKAFMVVADDEANRPGWAWNGYLRGALITPLHPALLEMITNQATFLFESFCHYASAGLRQLGGRAFTEKRWEGIAELANIQRPVLAILADPSLVLDTNCTNHGYLHLLGHGSGDLSSIDSRVLLRDEDEDEEEDITDTELFGQTRFSQLIERQLLEYRKLHDFADDGISVGVYCCADMQPIISGVDSYLASIMKERPNRQYSLALTVFSDSRYDSAFIRWMNAWKRRWQEAESSGPKQHYRNCMISVAYRVVSTQNRSQQLERLLRDVDLDVMFFLNFMDSSISRFEPLRDDDTDQFDYRKFPVLEKTCCRVLGGGLDDKRERILSNGRFQLGKWQAELTARVQDRHRQADRTHAVISTADFTPWLDVMRTAHKRSSWVVCVDPSIDEELLRRHSTNDGSRREIIGFGSGVGAHGEHNYTVSTEQFSLADIGRKVGLQASRLLGPLEHDAANRVAERLIREAEHLAGLSIVKATGPSEYVRDYIAYSMVRKLLGRDKDAFCDQIVSLDGFWHWFDDAEERRRPDLLRIRARIVDGDFDIKAQVIECKLAAQSEGYLEEARQQLESGLKQLVARFRPREESGPAGLRDKLPDQRFWWMQLHRLIAGKGITTTAQYTTTLRALERLSNGYFDIEWQAAAVAFWTDSDAEVMECRPQWSFSLDGQEMAMTVCTAGRQFVIQSCLDDSARELFCGDSTLKYQFPRESWENKPIQDADSMQPMEDGSPGVGLESSDGETKPAAGSVFPSDTHPTSGIRREQEHGIPDRILLGSATVRGKNIYWEFGHGDLPNRHMIVFGASGSGKTYAIQTLLLELAKAGQNSLIVDYTNGFSTGQLEPVIASNLRPVQHVVRQAPMPINPFRRQCDYIDDQPLPEDPAGVARRVADLFGGVYELGDQQRSILYSVIRDGVSEEGDTFDLASMVEMLENAMHEPGPVANPAMTVLSKIRPFVDMNPFGQEDEESWERIFADADSRCHIIQLAGFPRDSARLITEFSLFDFYWYYRANGHKDRPRVVVLDEIQNLDHKLDSPLGQLLTEGRKFGVSLILATQTMSNLSKDQRDRLFQASHKLFFRPADTEVRSFAQILSDATNQPQSEWVDRLASLKRGECYSLGHSLNERVQKLEVGDGFRIRVEPLEARL